MQKISLWDCEQLHYLSNFPNLKELDLSHAIINGSLDHVTSLTNLEILNLQWFGIITDGRNPQRLIPEQHLQLVGRLTRLKSLTLSQCQVTDFSDFEFLSRLNKLTKLDLSSTNLVANCFRNATTLTSLEYLNVSDTRLSTRGLSYIRFFTNLTHLEMAKVKVGSFSVLWHFQKLTKLKVLNLHKSNFVGLWIQYLRSLTNLRSLRLSAIVIRDDQLQHLTFLTQLVTLDLRKCNCLSGEGIFYLQKLTTLTDLNLQFKNLQDRDLSYVANLTNLQCLSCCNVSDVGLFYLTNLQNLVKIELRSCYKVTQNAIKVFADKQCKVFL